MGLLYSRYIPIAKGIDMVVPLVGEILDVQDEYFGIVTTILATPTDMMVELDDAKIDFMKISDYDLFCLLFDSLKTKDTSLVFKDLDLSKFHIAINKATEDVVIANEDDDSIFIDRLIYMKICNCIETILQTKKNHRKPGNEEAKEYELKKARRKRDRELKRRKGHNEERMTQFENNIVALVNTEQFPYTYNTVKDITLLQFNMSMKQISHKITYDNTMHGYYVGMIRFEDIPQDVRSWIQISK